VACAAVVALLVRVAPADAAAPAPPSLTPVLQIVDTDAFPAFSDDGRLMTTHGWAGRGVRIWDVRTRSLLRALPAAFDVALGPGGAWLLTEKGQIFDTPTLAVLGTLPIQHPAARMLMSEDGKTAVFLTPNAGEGTRACIDVWDVPSRSLTRSFFDTPDVRNIGQDGRAAISADGRILLAGVMSGPDVGHVTFSLQAFDTTTGQTVSSVPGAVGQRVHLSRSGNLATYPDSNAGVQVILDVHSGRVLRQLACTDGCGGAAVFTRDEKQLIQVQAGGTVTTWDTSSWTTARSFQGPPAPTTAGQPGYGDLAVAPDGQTLAIVLGGVMSPHVTAWSASGSLLGPFGHARGSNNAGLFGVDLRVMGTGALAPAGLASGGDVAYVGSTVDTHGLLEWDARTLSLRRTLKDAELPRTSALEIAHAISSDRKSYGRFNGQFGVGGAFELHDLASDAIVGTLRPGEGEALEAELAPQSRLLVRRMTPSPSKVAYAGPQLLQVYSVPDLALLDTVTAGAILAARLSGDGTRLVAAAETQGHPELVVYDTKAHAVSLRTPRAFNGTSIAVDATGSHALWSAVDSVAWIDLATGRELWSRPASSITVASELSPDGAFATTVGISGEVRRWRLDSGDSVSATGTATDDWIMFSDDGYFDASRDGGSLVSLVRGLQPFPVEQLAVRYNRPDILLSRLGVGTPELVMHYKARFESRLRALGLTEADVSHVGEAAPTVDITDIHVDGTTAEVTANLKPAAAALKTFQVIVNGAPLYAGQGLPVPSGAASAQVALVPGLNRIEVTTFDASGAESLHAFRDVQVPGSARGDLYFLGIGVSKYKDPRLSLQYAAKDAADLAAAVSAQKGGRFEAVHAQTLLDDQVTADGIRKAKAFFATSRPQDTLVALVAGHGARAGDAAAEYYFATYDTDVKSVATTAAPFQVIESLFDGVAARKKLLLLDTCESGERDEATGATAEGGARGIHSRALVLDDGPARAGGAAARAVILDRERFIYRDLSRRTGALVLASSRGSESSYEFDELRNGAFTASIKTALGTTQADADGDGVISIDELRRFVAKDVAAHTGDKQHPTLDRDNPLALVAFAVASGSGGTSGADDAADREQVHARGCACGLAAPPEKATKGLVASLAIGMLAWGRARRRASPGVGRTLG
jgi:WD40 repeat protein